MKDNADAIFTWDYEKGARPALNKLYEKAKTLAVERRDRPAVGHRRRPGAGRRGQRAGQRPGSQDIDLAGTCFAKWGDDEWLQLGIEIAELDAQPVHAR